jgi:hypothetical protein
MKFLFQKLDGLNDLNIILYLMRFLLATPFLWIIPVPAMRNTYITFDGALVLFIIFTFYYFLEIWVKKIFKDVVIANSSEDLQAARTTVLIPVALIILPVILLLLYPLLRVVIPIGFFPITH